MKTKSKEGYTLVETLIAMFIFAILLLGLLAGLIATYDFSTRNLIRDEAIKIAQETLEKYRYKNFDDINSENKTVTRQIRNNNITFNVSTTVTDEVAGEMKRVTAYISWNYKGKNYSYQIETLIRKE